MSLPRPRIGLIATALLLAGAAPAQPPATTQARPASLPQPVDWHAATREDVLAAYDIFRRHHPGMFDPRNRAFPALLRHARDVALAFGSKVHDEEGHARALAEFSAVLADAHARVQAGYNGHGPILWPGFRTVWRGDHLQVSVAGSQGPPRGSALLACDGRDARTLIRAQAFTFMAGRPKEAGQWWTDAPYFFLRAPSHYESLPRICAFRTPQGLTKAYRLDWRALPETTLQQWFKVESRREPIGLTQPRRGMYRITLTTFAPDDQGRAQYDRLFHDVDQNIGQMAAARALIIDLRNNQGGSSSWGEDVADRLWGKAAVDSAMARYFRRTKVWWLADAANVAHFREAAATFRGRKIDAVAEELDKVADNLAVALKRGKRFYVEDYGASLARDATGARPRKLPPVYVITDGGCVSACLDALDIFTRFPEVKLVGAPTSADSNYLEIRFEALPSDRGAVILPTKIWDDRPRRAGQVYHPDIPVNDLDWTTATILDHIERDLVARR